MTTANVGFWENGYTGFFWISSMRDLTVYSRYTLKWMKRRIILCSSNMGYIEDNFGNCGTLTISYGFLTLTLSPHLPLPGKTKTEQCNNSTTGKYYQKGCFERPRAVVGSLSDPQNTEKAVRILQAAKGKRTTKTLLFYLVWSQSNPSSLSLNVISPEIGIYDPVKKQTQKKSTVFRFPALKPLACFQIITSHSKLSRRSYLLQAWRRLHDFPRWHAFFPRF